MAVSSNTLFHFTKSYETLLKILHSKGFWPRYCIEYGWGSKHEDFAVAQSCFCDIPLSQIQNHTKNYGHYGLGMDKDWAIKNNLSIIHYLANKSTAVKIIEKMRKAAKNMDCNSRNEYLAFVKKYKGNMWRQNDRGEWRETRNVIFYNEREWRYVPIIDGRIVCKQVKNFRQFDVNAASEETKKYMCSFEAKDIKYIIIESEEERMIFLEELDKMNFDDKDLPLLKSKIITAKQIEEDF